MPDGNLQTWLHVREFAVPPTMIKTATARRAVGDWAGACAAARVDIDLSLRGAATEHGREFAATLRADLRHLVPDLLRWHFPRVAPDGMLRPGLTVALIHYRWQRVHLVARTAPAWADSGQRISLALRGGRRTGVRHPSRRFRLDLHRHLWDARHTAELPARADVNAQGHLAVGGWPVEAALLRRADGKDQDPVSVRAGSRRLVLHADGSITPGVRDPAYPVLPAAATWLLPDLALLRAGLIEPGRLHPLVASALGHAWAERSTTVPPSSREVRCRGAAHRIGLVDGVLAPLDHTADEIRRERLLVALGGEPTPCLRAIDEANRFPAELPDIRARLDHGDMAGALAAVESLIGPAARLEAGDLRDALAGAAARRLTYGLYRAGLTGRGPCKQTPKVMTRARNS